MISPELLSKLERRRRLQQEVVYQACRAASTGPRGVQHASAATTSASSTATPLRSRLDTIKEGAKTNYKSKELARNIELGAEVARLRIDVEVLERELEVSRLQAAKLRAGANLEQRRNRTKGAVSDLPSEESQHHCIARIAEMRKQNMALEEEIGVLEEEVASHVVGRVHLETTLQNSQDKEQEMWRLVEDAEHRKRERSCEHFAMDDSSDSIVSGANLELAAAADLENCFENLGRYGGLAGEEHAEGDHNSEHSLLADVDHDEAGHSETVDYEAPLQVLEFALTRLRSSIASNGSHENGVVNGVVLEAGSGGSNNYLHSEERDSGIAAGTGEAADSVIAYDRHIENLQTALGRLSLSTSGAAPDSSFAGPTEDAQEAAPAPLLPPPVGLQLLNPYVSLGHRFRTSLWA